MPSRTTFTPAKKQDPFKTNGGNGGYSKRQRLTDTPNPQKRKFERMDYHGNDVTRNGKKA